MHLFLLILAWYIELVFRLNRIYLVLKTLRERLERSSAPLHPLWWQIFRTESCNFDVKFVFKISQEFVTITANVLCTGCKQNPFIQFLIDINNKTLNPFIFFLILFCFCRRLFKISILEIYVFSFCKVLLKILIVFSLHLVTWKQLLVLCSVFRLS